MSLTFCHGFLRLIINPMRCIVQSCPSATVEIRKSPDALEGWASDKHRINLGRYLFPVANMMRKRQYPSKCLLVYVAPENISPL